MIDESFIEYLSRELKDPPWLRKFRKEAFERFKELPYPKIPYKIKNFDIEKLTYYAKPLEKLFESWEEVPIEIKRTLKALGISEKEIEYFAGLSTIQNSHPIFIKIREYLKNRGVIFDDIIRAARRYPDLVKKYLGKIVKNDNKLSALNSCVFTAGSFIYVPPNVKIKLPLHTIFRMTLPEFGQFERTLMIVDKNSEVTFIEGCVSPLYSKWNLHIGVVEVFLNENSKAKLITLQNWSKNVVNFVFSRAILKENAYLQLVEAHLGSKLVMKYPTVVLDGENSKIEILEVMYSGRDQIKDMGAKVYHLRSNTRSRILSKAVSKENGINVFRGLVRVESEAKNAIINSQCDSLILDPNAKAYTYPKNEILNTSSFVSHEAKVGKLDEEKILYLCSRGISKAKALALLTLGFFEPVIKIIPLEYLIEFKRLIEFEFEGIG